MTNETFTEPTTITIDGTDFRIAPLPTDDRACLRLMLELQRDAAKYLLDNASHDLEPDTFDHDIPMTQFDYSGDHDDYMPAAAELLTMTTYALSAHIHDTARAALIELITAPDSEFCDASITADFNSPLLDLISDPDFD